MTIAGLVVAAMGWVVLAEDADAPAAGGPVFSGREEAPAVLGGENTREETPLVLVEEEPRERVPVSWERKTGAQPAVRARMAEPAVERTRTRPEEQAKRKRRAVRPERRERPAKRADHVKPIERGKTGASARRTVVSRGAGEPAGNPFSRFVGGECERRLAGAGPLCSMLLDQVFAGGQAHGGR